MSEPSLTRLVASCDALQRSAITSEASPLLVIASAGSGKTRVLTRRIAWLVLSEKISARHVLALTFTRKAASELRERLTRLGMPEPVMAGTFHAVAFAQLRQRAVDRGEQVPVVVESKTRLLGALVPQQIRTARGAPVAGDRRDSLGAIANEIEWAKARLVTPDDYAIAAAREDRVTSIDPQIIADAYFAYEREKRRRRIVDFDDLLRDLADAIRDDPNFAAAQRWCFRHFFVDEIQDANPAQFRLLDAWLGDRRDLCAVGDPRQAIYGWNGADFRAIDRFASRYDGTTVLRLETNYRSTPQVVSAATAALPRDERGLPESPRPDGEVPTLTVYDDERAEAEGVARLLRGARSPIRPWSDFAILARTNAQLARFEEACRALAIPTRRAGAPGFLTDPAVHHALGTLRDVTDARRFGAWLDDLAARLRPVRAADDEIDPDDELDGSTTRNDEDDVSGDETYLRECVRLGAEYRDLDPVASGSGFLTFVREALRADFPTRSGNAVDLATFHRAKGLEWPVVFVTGIEEGFVPISHARSADALAEERRLLYVALSRAADELHCSWARARHFGARRSTREPSPWLVGIDNARRSLERQRQPNPDAARLALAESRSALADAAASPTPPRSRHRYSTEPTPGLTK